VQLIVDVGRKGTRIIAHDRQSEWWRDITRRRPRPEYFISSLIGLSKPINNTDQHHD
jgi:hypothetical protein